MLPPAKTGGARVIPALTGPPDRPVARTAQTPVLHLHAHRAWRDCETASGTARQRA